MKINHRHYILIIFALLSITVAASAYFFLYKKTTEQADNYLNDLKEIETEKSSVAYEENLLKTFNEYKEQRDKIESYIIKEADLVKFIERIEKIGQQTKTKLELSSISSGDNKIKARVGAEGSWQNVMTALMIIENLPVSMSINNVRLDTTSDLEKAEASSTQAVTNWRLTLDIEAITTK